MKRVVLKLILLSLILPAPLFAQDLGQSGRFPVFGPSAEREKFFQDQADQRAADAAEHQRQQIELEKARIEASAAEPASSEPERTLRYLPIYPGCRTRTTIVRSFAGTAIYRDTPYGFCDRPNLDETQLGLSIGSDGEISADVSVRRPGFQLFISAD